MNIVHKLRIFKYYMSVNPNQPVSLMRIIIDTIFIDVAIWILVYIWMVSLTKSPVLSVLISLAAIVLLDAIIYKAKYNTYIKNRKKRRRESVINHLSHRISQLNVQEFQLQLIKILLNCKGFSNIIKEKGLLKADYNGMPVIIGFHHPAPGEKTPFSKVWEFAQQAKILGFEQGFFFTSASFEENCNKEKFEGLGLSIRLMDCEYIMDRMEEAGMFPDENTIDQLIAGEIRKEKVKKQKLKSEVLAQNKSKQYILVSILFLIAGVLFKGSRVYYLAVSLLFAAIAFLANVLSLKYSETREESQPSSQDRAHNLR